MASIVVLAENEITVGSGGAQVPTPLNENVGALVFIANSSNTASVYLGASGVTTSGANRGYEMFPGDKVIAPVVGPGATEFYFVAASDQSLTVQQWG